MSEYQDPYQPPAATLQPAPAPQVPDALRQQAIAQGGGAPIPQPIPQPAAQTSVAALAAAAGEPLARPDESDVVRLSQAYQAHDVEVRTVRFREPTGRDIKKIGVPLRFVMPEDGSSQAEVKINSAAMSAYMVALSEPPLPMSTVDQFRASDWNDCSNVISGFFQQ